MAPSEVEFSAIFFVTLWQNHRIFEEILSRRRIFFFLILRVFQLNDLHAETEKRNWNVEGEIKTKVKARASSCRRMQSGYQSGLRNKLILNPMVHFITEVQEFKDEKTQVDFRFDGIFLKYYFLVKSQVVSFSC